MLARSRRRCLVSVGRAVARQTEAVSKSNGRFAVDTSRPFNAMSMSGPSQDPSSSLVTWNRQQQKALYHATSHQCQMPLKPPLSKRLVRAQSSTSTNILSSQQLTSNSNPLVRVAAAWRKPPRRQRISAAMPVIEADDSEDAVARQSPPSRRVQQPAPVYADWEVLDEAGQDDDPTVQAVNEAQVSIVEAFYAAQTIDLAPLAASDLATNVTRRKFNKDNLLLELSSKTAQNDSNPSYVAIYRFGSVIFFNVSPRIQKTMLQAIKKHALEPLAQGLEQKDTFIVCVMPNVPRSQVTSEHCIVPNLNMNAVAVISEVMAQSVALESYNEIVDSLLEKFAILNSTISRTNKMDLDKKMLFSKIAQNNRIFIDLISKIRIKKRNQIAWDQMEFEVIHSGMTREFDIDDRFELIQFKLDLIQQNSKLFLEVIQHQKSASLEWVIVVLIGFECGLMILEMTGQGSALFEYAKTLIL
jgi:uncharacterized Rmd1/YagE family protein